MSLKKLIKNQTIIIDDHKRGSREIKNFDNSKNDVHIDKITNFRVDGIVQKIRIKIPLNSDNPINVRSKTRKIELPMKLRKEIIRSFENKETRTEFIKDVVKTLSNYESILSTKLLAQKVLNRLSKHFDLKWNKEKIEQYSNEALISYTQFYNDDKGKTFFIKLEKSKLTIGENNGYAKIDKL